MGRTPCNSIQPTRAELAAYLATAATTSEYRRWQVILLITDGVPLDQIAASTGYRARTIRQIVQRYQQGGPAALVDQRTRGPGAAPLLTPAQQDELRLALAALPKDGGVWTGPKVAQWIEAKTGKRVHRQRGWEYLRRLSTDKDKR
jgi:transposase